MLLPTKFTLPEIAREKLTPKEQEVLAWTEQLVEMANSLQQENEQLKRKVAYLKKSQGQII